MGRAYRPGDQWQPSSHITSRIMAEEHIVVVGGGYGGITAARALHKQGANFTLISNRDMYYHNIASVRALTEKDWNKKCLLPLREMFGENFKVGSMAGVNTETKEVLLEGGDKVKYSTLVIATGTQGTFPYSWDGTDSSEALKGMECMRAACESAGRILVIGGGPTGVEQAAEFAAKWPQKEITLLHAREKLIMDGLVDEFYTRLDAILDEVKIKVIRGEKVENLDQIDLEHVKVQTVSTNKGTKLETDFVCKAIGLYVDPSPYKNGLGSAVTDRGQLKVNEYLEVEGFKDVYAVGDCNNRPPQMAYAAQQQSELLVKNIYHKKNNEELEIWKDEASLFVKIVMSVGPHHGLGQFPDGRLFPEENAINFKAKDLMVEREWTRAGLPIP